MIPNEYELSEIEKALKPIDFGNMEVHIRAGRLMMIRITKTMQVFQPGFKGQVQDE